MNSSRLNLKAVITLAALSMCFSMCFVSPAQGSRGQDSPGQDSPGQDSQSQPPRMLRKSGGLLQRSAISRVSPTYPPLAKAAKISGSVVVEVTIDEAGSVIAARAISGHPLLKDSAVAAARQWKFSETKLQGEPVKVIGTITFHFSADDSKDIEALKTEVAANPESAKAHFKLGEAYLAGSSNVTTNAVDSFKKAIEITPEFAEAYLKLGQAYCKAHTVQGQEEHTKQEIEAFEHAIRLSPDSAEAYFGLANSHIYRHPLKTEENLRAAGLLKYAVKLKPDYYEAYVTLCSLYQLLDRNDEAVDALKQFAQLNPQQGNPLLARAYVRLRRYEDAVEVFKQMLEDTPANYFTRFELGSAYTALGNKELAMKEYETLKLLDEELAERLLKAINN